MLIATLLQQPPQAADEASARELLDCATGALRTRRLAEVAELELATQWAIVHGHPRDDRDPMVTPGGDGTPAVREHAIPELAMARETHPATHPRADRGRPRPGPPTPPHLGSRPDRSV